MPSSDSLTRAEKKKKLASLMDTIRKRKIMSKVALSQYLQSKLPGFSERQTMALVEGDIPQSPEMADKVYRLLGDSASFLVDSRDTVPDMDSIQEKYHVELQEKNYFRVQFLIGLSALRVLESFSWAGHLWDLNFRQGVWSLRDSSGDRAVTLLPREWILVRLHQGKDEWAPESGILTSVLTERFLVDLNIILGKNKNT